MNPRFYFAACQAGAEKAVKAEVSAALPQLRFAFSRPGFVTFKEEDDSKPPVLFDRSIFCRLWGEALGQAKDAGALKALLAQVPKDAVVQRFERDQFIPGEEPEDFVWSERIDDLLEDCGIEIPYGEPKLGETVYSCIWIDDFHVFLGRHVHRSDLSGLPGNGVNIPLPEGAPSRAYLKIEEAILRFKPELKAGMSVLEIGCAPGGATTALLARGLKVTGVDPQYMAPEIFADPDFVSVRKAARYLEAPDLKKVNPDWLVADMSIAPLEALDELGHAMGLLKANCGSSLRLRGAFLTIKLNDWGFVPSIPLYMRRIEQLGFRGLKPLQLCSNRREFFVWAPRFVPR